MSLVGKIPLVDRVILLDHFGDRYHWGRGDILALEYDEAQLLMKAAEYRNKRAEAEAKRSSVR